MTTETDINALEALAMAATPKLRRQHELGLFDYSREGGAVFSYGDAADLLAALLPILALAREGLGAKTLPVFRHIDDWTEDMYDVLWFHYPLQEPPYCGTPLDDGFDPEWHQWWMPLPDDKLVAAGLEAAVALSPSHDGEQ